MNTYETLLYLATNPCENKIAFPDELKSSEAILNELKKEFITSPINHPLAIDTRQASETMVY